MFQRILVAVGGSPVAGAALWQAVDLALGERARLTLVATLPRLPAVAYLAPVTPVGELADARAACEKGLRQAVGRVPDELPVTTLLVEGPAHRALVREVRRGGYDLLVVGSSTRRRLPAALGGDLGAALVRRCAIPVLVVRSPALEAGVAGPQPATVTALGIPGRRHARA